MSYGDAIPEVKAILEAKNEEEFVTFTSRWSAEERKELRTQFQDATGSEFIAFLKKCIKNGPYEDIMALGWDCNISARVNVIKKAMKGVNDFRAIHDVILIATPDERLKLAQAYQEKTGNDLFKDITDQIPLNSASSYLCHLALKENRVPRGSVAGDAEVLKHNLLDADEPDHEAVVRLLITSTADEYKEINHRFEVLTGKSVQEAIETKYADKENARGLCIAHFYNLAPARAVAYAFYSAVRTQDDEMAYEQAARITGLFHELHKFAWVHYACWGVMRDDIISRFQSKDANKVNFRDACLMFWKLAK